MKGINPDILVWARESCSFSQDVAVKKLGIKDGKNKTAIDKLRDMESGLTAPSRPMLLKMAKQYKRSLLTFYLENPPKKGDRGKDFRTLPNNYSKENDALLNVLIRDISVRQDLVYSALEDEESPTISFINSLSLKDDIKDTAKKLIDFFKFNTTEFVSAGNNKEAFKFLRNKVENAGVFVLLAGDLGSYHSDISSDIFRGFALANNVAPFIVINDNDASTAWSFTLLHELVHLGLGETGVSSSFAEMKIEKFCNDVAAEILLPSKEIENLGITVGMNFENLKQIITSCAKKRNVSRPMVAYSIYRKNLIGKSTWYSLRNKFDEEWKEYKRKSKEKNIGKKDSGPNYYVIKKHRLGKALLNFVGRTINEGLLTPTKAGKILGTHPRSVNLLLSS